MKNRWIVHIVCLLVMLAATTGCRNKQQRPDKLTDGLSIPEHFKYIPADSPYVMADIKAFPYDKYNWQWMDGYQKMVSGLRQSMQESMPEDAQYVSKDQLLAMAVLEEMDGRMSKEGLAELGIATNAHIALYGLGVFPAFRMELSDSAKFEAMIARIESRVGESLPVKQYDKWKVRYIQDDDVFIPIIVTENELLMGVSSASFEQEFLGYLTGKTPVEKSLFKENKLLSMQKKYNMLPYISGYVSTQGTVNVLTGMDKTSMLARSFASIVDAEDIPQLSDVCKAEYQQLSKEVPRFVFGYTNLGKNSVTALSGVEVNSGLPERLMAAKAPIPGHGNELQKNALLSMGLGVDLAKFIEVLREEAQRIGQNPYKCEELDWMNESAEKFYFNAQQVPPFVRSIQGLSFVLSDLGISDNQIKKIQMVAVLHSSNPQELWSSVQPFIENITQTPIVLTANGQAVSVPLPQQVTMTMPDLPVPMLSMTKIALGLAMGPGMSDVMASQMKASAKDALTPIFTFGYDIGRFYEVFNTAMPGIFNSDPSMAASMEMYKTMGPTMMKFDVQKGGFFVTGDVMFNNEPAE